MKPERDADELFEEAFVQIGRAGNLQTAEDLAAEANGVSKPDADPAAFTHVRDGGVAGQNPAFAQGIEFARMAPDQKLEALDPGPFLQLAEVEKDGLVALRDSRRKSVLIPGENLYSTAASGNERYQAKVRGRVVVIGNTIHVLPSDVDGKLSARVESGNLMAYLDIHPSFGLGRMPDLAVVREYLEKNNIRYGIRETSIVDALKICLPNGKSVRKLLVAQGFGPLAGTPGAIEYFFDRDFQGPVPMDLDEEGKIDFRNVKWIPMVTKDQILARVTHSIPGTDGMDVSGGIVAAKAIPPAYLVKGCNVRADEKESEFFSEIDGCAQLNGSLISVMNIFVVNSDVDYHSGNIRFKGNIMITGSVRKGFEVEADGDLVVVGNVEPSRIKAGRDIHVKGGVLGAGKGEFCIEAGRDITAGYAQNACLDAQGDIDIENFSIQSFLNCSGRISLGKQKGLLVGGEAIAAKSVEAKAFGTPTGVKTYVTTGIDYALKRKQKSLMRQMSELKDAMLKIDAIIRSLAKLSSQGALHPSKVQALREIVERRKQIANASTATTVRLQELVLQQDNLEPGLIKAIEVVHPEVYLTIRNRSLKISEIINRALFRLDAKGEHIVRQPA